MRALKTDLYQLMMAAGYFQRGMQTTRVSCEAFMRKLPPRRRFVMMAGLARISEYLEQLSFDEDELRYLREIPALRDAMTPKFCDYLRGLRFTGDLWAMPEGQVAFQGEPLVRVTAPIIEAQLAETFILSVLNHSVKVASKAARVVLASGRASIVEFGTRRTHDESAIDAARAAVIAGCTATSNLEAGRRFALPVTGTMAHMWIMAHSQPGRSDSDSEQIAFRNYLDTFPDQAVFLVDTYDTPRGVANAIRAAGARLKAIRLDSGDLLTLSRDARKQLDAAGLQAAKIIASSGLDEHAVAKLVEAGAPIDVYGVGENITEPVDAPITGIVYKLVENHTSGRMVAKRSSGGKATLPGTKQVFRVKDKNGMMASDEIGLHTEAPSGRDMLLRQVMQGGRICGTEFFALDAACSRARAELAAMPEALRKIPSEAAADALSHAAYTVKPSAGLEALAERTLKEGM